MTQDPMASVRGGLLCRPRLSPMRMALLTLLCAFACLLLSNLGHAQLPVTQSWAGNTFCATTPGYQWMANTLQGVCAAKDGTKIYTNCHYDEGSCPIRQFDAASGAAETGSKEIGGNGCGYAVACNSTMLCDVYSCRPTPGPRPAAWGSASRNVSASILPRGKPRRSPGHRAAEAARPIFSRSIRSPGCGESFNNMPYFLMGLAAERELSLRQ